LSSQTTVSFRRRIKTPSSFTSTSATKKETPQKTSHLKEELSKKVNIKK
jgi:hypothetical protein